MPDADGDRPTVQATATAFRLVETLRSKGGARVTELADELGVAKSTVHRHLTTLTELGYIVRRGDEYDVGLGFLALGEYARTRAPAYDRLRPKVAALAEATGESVQFLVPERDRAVYVHRETGANAVDTPNSRLGESIPLHATAAGKAILSCHPPERVDEVVDRTGLPAVTANTITDRDRLREELDEIRERGLSVNREENVEGVWAYGVPVRGPDGGPLGALSVSGPAHRLRKESVEEALSARLLETANEVELNIAYS
jgi:DNA-binding IclR family transcriptional regulator